MSRANSMLDFFIYFKNSMLDLCSP